MARIAIVLCILLLTACKAATIAPIAPPAEPLQELEFTLIAEGFVSPIDVLSAPGDDALYVVDQPGVVYRDGAIFFDLRPKMVSIGPGFDERGLLGFAFHPNYAENHKVYASYSAPLRPTAPPGWNYTRVVSEFTVRDFVVDLDSERKLLALDWETPKHNGGGLAFGPDEYLYVALGDGGCVHGTGNVEFSAFDSPAERAHCDTLAQDLNSFYGKILRIAIDENIPYGIPEDNPTVGLAGIYAWGFRNPYRIAFDTDGELYVTATGETLWESVYQVKGPGNYGWAVKEGTHCFDRQKPFEAPPSCAVEHPYGWPIHDPIVEYANMAINQVGGEGVGTAVTGARVYRGSQIPWLWGKLLITDWSEQPATPSGQLFIVTPVGDAPRILERVAVFNGRIQSIGQDAAGELYILTSDEYGPTGNTGKVYKIVPKNF